MGDIKETNRKQVAPLALQKFLSEYSEYQKWAAHNMLRPSSVQSFALYTFPPRGRLEIRLQILQIFAQQKQGKGKA